MPRGAQSGGDTTTSSSELAYVSSSSSNPCRRRASCWNISALPNSIVWSGPDGSRGCAAGAGASVESVIKRTAGEENAGQARRRQHEVVDAAGAGVARVEQTRSAALQAVQAAHKAISAYTAQGLSFDSRLWRTCTNRIDATSEGDCKHRSIDAASASGRTYGSRLMRVATDWADEVSWRACTSQCGVI